MPFFGWGFIPGFGPGGYYLPGGAGLAFDFTTGILPPGITFTRASVGTYYNNTNILLTAAINTARFNFASGSRCLLIEPTATNLLVQSNNFGTTWFPINGGVITPAQFISPDSTNDGWSLTSGTGFGGAGQTATYSAVPYTFSIWAMRIVGVAPLLLKLNAATSGDITLTTTIARYFANITPAAATDGAYIVTDGSAGSTNGIFGAQVETGSVMTSYIVTGAATATRAADVATFTIPLGITKLTYTFDDNSTQQVTVSAGSYTIPTNLSRPNIKSILGS